MGLLKMFESKEGQSLSILADPFKKEKVTRIVIFMYPQANDVHGTVEFRNGLTKGEQDFRCNSLAQIAHEMESFINSL